MAMDKGERGCSRQRAIKSLSKGRKVNDLDPAPEIFASHARGWRTTGIGGH